MTKHTFFIDYDGVILNSFNEKLFTGYNAYYILNNNTKLFNSEKLTFDNYQFQINHNVNLVRLFRCLVPFIGIAGENACAFKIIESSKKLPANKVQFKNAINHFCNDQYYEYNKLVKSLREKYSKNSSEKFLNLCPSHKKIIEIIKTHSDQINWEIISNKPMENILYFNEQFKIDKSISGVHYCDANIDDKSEMILKIAKEKEINNQQIFFIDDLYINLKSLHYKGAKCMLADWGFESDEIKNIASSLGINVLTKLDFKMFVKSLF